jgi:amino acid transporter
MGAIMNYRHCEMRAIALVAPLYVTMSLVVFGNLDIEEATAARDFARARAAQPVLAKTGFVVVGLAAMVSTASAINANLYAATNVAYRMATLGELPAAFGRPISRSREGLLISAVIVALLVPTLELTSFAVIGSLTILSVHIALHVGHLRLVGQTGANTRLEISLPIGTPGGVHPASLPGDRPRKARALPRSGLRR